ncbi:hypothetical protein OROGR_020463 [Orobanche gracilis]
MKLDPIKWAICKCPVLRYGGVASSYIAITFSMVGCSNPPVAPPTLEMLDSSDTQMNAMYDDLATRRSNDTCTRCPTGAGGVPGGLEQPTIEKVIAMYDDATPPAQSILPCAVGSSRYALLQTMTSLAIPKVILNVRPIRRRLPAAAVRSYFLHDNIRGRDTFDDYLSLEDGEIFQINSLKGVHSNIALTSSYLMEIVEGVFDVMHRGMREEFQRYDHNLFDPTIEEVIPVEEIDRLCLFAEAVQPNWGDNMKQ